MITDQLRTKRCLLCVGAGLYLMGCIFSLVSVPDDMHITSTLTMLNL